MTDTFVAWAVRQYIEYGPNVAISIANKLDTMDPDMINEIEGKLELQYQAAIEQYLKRLQSSVK